MLSCYFVCRCRNLTMKCVNLTILIRTHFGLPSHAECDGNMDDIRKSRGGLLMRPLATRTPYKMPDSLTTESPVDSDLPASALKFPLSTPPIDKAARVTEIASSAK